MSLNRLFDSVEKFREAAQWRAAFGEPYQVDDRTIIPVAQVSYGFGLGFGSADQSSVEDEGTASDNDRVGGGGGSSVKPLGAIVVTPDMVYFEQARDETKIVLFALGMIGYSLQQIARTVRVLFGH